MSEKSTYSIGCIEITQFEFLRACLAIRRDVHEYVTAFLKTPRQKKTSASYSKKVLCIPLRLLTAILI